MRLLEALLVAGLVGLLSSTVYLVMVAYAAWRFLTRPRQHESASSTAPTPAVSVLKPVHGAEPKLEECLESFFTQNYPTFELIFAARSASDAALQVVERIRTRHPGVKVRTVIAGEAPYPNAKVAALERMLEHASYPCVVIADSDVRVESDYLAHVVKPLLDRSNGLVTCVYRGVSAGGWWSALEALGMSVEMTSGVLVADMLEGMRFALGPTMAMRKDVLDSIGGVGRLGAYCADDYVLGQLVHAAGYRVVLSHHVIDHMAVNRSLRQSWQHHVRWMRSTRFSRPAGHIGTLFTFAMPFGILACVAAFANGQPRVALACLAWAVANRVVQCLAIGGAVVRDPTAATRCAIYPLRDLIGFAAWCSSFFGSAIVWRGERYDLVADGMMRPRELVASRRAIGAAPGRGTI